MQQVEQRLTVRTAVGGVARYEGDGFLRATGNAAGVPGNPWIPCSLWLAQYKIARAQTPVELRGAVDILGWVAKQARPSGALPEQLHPFGTEVISVCPLAWSHAELIIAVRDYLDAHSRIHVQA
jgi:GH15 family glucan-1,4-alpha-glucosidase